MIPAPFIVVVDANVLFPLTLRDTVLRAVKAAAQVITTANLKDFSPLPEGLEAQSPDEFLCNLFDLEPDGFVELLREQAAALVKPPVAFDDLLKRLARVVPGLVAAVQDHLKVASMT